MSYLTQMLALSVQNFLSAATGIAVVFALFRGFAARATGAIGNFWVDVTRITAWLLLPLSLVFAIFLVGQGVIQNFDAYKDVSTLEATSYQQPKNGADGQALKDDKGNAVMPYNAAASSGANQGPLNPALAEAVKGRVAALRAADPGNTAPVPVDLVTASASGLDPHISPAAARYQAARVAKARNLPLEKVQALVDQHTEQPLLGFLGEPQVNVLQLNLALE